MRVSTALIGLLMPFFGMPAFAADGAMSLDQIVTETCALKNVKFNFTDDTQNTPLIARWQRVVDSLEQLYGKSGDDVPSVEADQRLQISQCTREFMENRLKDFKASGRSLSLINANTTIELASQAIATNHTDLQKYVTKAGTPDVSLRSLALMQLNQSKLSFSQFLDLIRSSKPEERGALLYAEQFLQDYSGPAYLKGAGEMYASTISAAQLNAGQMQSAVHGMVRMLLSNAFSYSRLGIQRKIEQANEDLKDAKDEDSKSSFKNQIAELTPMASGLSYDEFEKSLRVAFTAHGLSVEVLNRALIDVRNDFEDHTVIDSLTIREGDILLEYDTDGFGSLFYAMAGIPSLISHSQIVFADHWGPVKFYFYAESLSGFSYGQLESLSDRVVVRMNGDLLRGRTAQILAQAQSRPFHFDTLFQDGLFDKSGKAYSLYCAEFIHYAFKNGLNPAAAERPSPFDYVHFQLDPSNQVLLENIRKIGFSPSSHFFLPDQLLFNPQTTLVGLGNVDHEIYIHPSRQHLADELHLRFQQLLGERFTHMPIRPIGLLERTTLTLKWKAASYFTDLDLSNMDFPEGDGGLYFMKFFMVANDYSLAVMDNGDSSTLLTDEQRQQILSKYQNSIVPEVNDLFDVVPSR